MSKTLTLPDGWWIAGLERDDGRRVDRIDGRWVTDSDEEGGAT